MTIALTGGTGFLGAAVLKRLVQAGHAVRLLVHRTPPEAYAGVEIIRGSLDDPAALDALVADAAAVIHLGGLVAAKRRDDFWRINADATRRLAEAARHASVPRFLLISSLAAREAQLSPYAESKRGGEEAVLASGLPGWDILRPPAIYGREDRQLLKLLVPLKHRLALLPAGPSARASVIHADDAASAILAWLALPRTTQGIYELDDGHAGGRTWRDMLGLAASLLDVTPRYLQPPRPLLSLAALLGEAAAGLTGNAPFFTRGKLAEMMHPDWVADSLPFQSLTGWRPGIPFETGLAETIGHYRARSWL